MNAEQVVQILTLVISLAAAITALTPTPRDDGWVRTVRKVLDALALNWGHAENRSPEYISRRKQLRK